MKLRSANSGDIDIISQKSLKKVLKRKLTAYLKNKNKSFKIIESEDNVIGYVIYSYTNYSYRIEKLEFFSPHEKDYLWDFLKNFKEFLDKSPKNGIVIFVEESNLARQQMLRSASFSAIKSIQQKKHNFYVMVYNKKGL